MDSVAADYDRLWISTTLRGLIAMFVNVKCLKVGLHSGIFGGTVPDSFMIMRNLISRFEDYNTGRIPLLEVDIPSKVYESTKITADLLKDKIFQNIPKVPSLLPLTTDYVEQLLNNSWRPSFVLTGSSGIPDISSAGNVLRPFTKAKFSFRIPPSLNVSTAFQNIKLAINKNVPYSATLEIEDAGYADGWVGPEMKDSLKTVLSEVSQSYYENDFCDIGFGGSIPVMNLLLQLYPKAQFMVSGVCNIDSFAHGPNENLDLTCCKKFICCLAQIVSEHEKI